MTFYANTVHSDTDKRNSSPDGKTRVPACRWRWLLIYLGCALLLPGAGTAAPGVKAKQWESPTVRPCHIIHGYHSEMTHVLLCTPSFMPPAGPVTAFPQWVWIQPGETESPDTELAVQKWCVISGFRPPGITLPGQVSLSHNQMPYRLYLLKKSLLC